MIKLNKKALGFSLSLIFAGVSQNSLAEGEIISSAASISANQTITLPVNLQDKYITEKLSFLHNSLKLDQIMLAAKTGDPQAQQQLGDIYRLGLGVTKSDVVALMWYTISDENGSKTASNDKSYTAGYMAGDQISLAYEMAEKWIRANN